MGSESVYGRWGDRVAEATQPTRRIAPPPLKRWATLLLFVTVAVRGATLNEAFEKAASELRFLAAADVLHGRMPDRFVPVADLETHNRVVGELLARGDSVEDLVPLLGHRDPKVRTLAVAALVWKGDPKVLPHLMPLCGDAAGTLPHPSLVAIIPGAEQDATPVEPQTVGEFPRAVLAYYLSAADFPPSGGPREFEAYWTSRKDRAFCASWFKVRLDRAGGRPEAVKAVRERIDRLSEADRAWTVLYLSGEYHPPYDEGETLAAAKRLGPDALMQTLGGKCPSSDPDLQPHPDGRNERVEKIDVWALKHAKELLRPSDVPALLALNLVRTPWYSIAAAELEPGRSREILFEAFERFPREGYIDGWARADIAMALWRLQGLSVSPTLVEWFYGETLRGEGSPHSRATFLRSLGPKDPNARKLVAALVRDERFSSVDWSSLKVLIPLVNDWAATPVVAAEDVAALAHPYGEQQVVQFPEQALKTYPEQTKALNATLAQWRQRVRESAPQWAKDR